MTVYVVEVAGRAVAAQDLDSRDKAEAWLMEPWFRANLLVLESDGEPLWDGRSALHLREAFEEEADLWRRTKRRSVQEGWATEGDGFLMYLVPVTDPADPTDAGSDG